MDTVFKQINISAQANGKFPVMGGLVRARTRNNKGAKVTNSADEVFD
jgi:hypothetical protein